ncbi:unnamed protein product, partial [Pylaiella littoralis]
PTRPGTATSPGLLREGGTAGASAGGLTSEVIGKGMSVSRGGGSLGEDVFSCP